MKRKILIERKELVKRLSELTGIKSKYLGVATQAYEIGSYKVTKEAELVFEEITDDIKTLEDEGLIEPDGEEAEEENRLTISMPRGMFTESAIENVKAFMESKGELLRHAFGVSDLDLEIDDEKVGFSWFKVIDAEHTAVYTQFVEAISDMAINQKKISAKSKEYPNEKYTFRCLLLRLGFIGKEYKQARKILLENLEGSSAFRDGKKKDIDNIETLEAKGVALTDIPAKGISSNDTLEEEEA